MKDLIAAWFEMFGSMFAVLLAHVEYGALVVGTLAAIAITQAVKMAVINSNLPNGPWRVWYLTTLSVGTVVTWLNWSTRLGFSWGLVAGGLLAPLLYLIGTRTLYKFWPDLRYRISATPKKVD